MNFKKINKSPERERKRNAKKKTKEELKQRIQKYKERIDHCRPKKLLVVWKEIETDPHLTEKEKDKLKIRILNKRSLPNNIVKRLKNNENLKPDMRWRLWEVEESNNQTGNKGPIPP